jgi:uncharacterized protein (TIGR02996 family)
MSAETDFVCALQATPQDVSLRLVFADWLEERGDPRGELLRLTHMLTQAIDVPGRPELEARLQTLLNEGVQPIGPFWTNARGLRFAWIPPGVFLMGSPDDEVGRDASEEQHEIRLTHGFWLGVHPVTQAQWQEVMNSNPSFFCAVGGGDVQVRRQDTGRFPVEQMSWEEAMMFCAYLDRVSRETPMAYRLPTEEEWEYACRAGTQTAFHFGASCDGSEVNCDGEQPYATSPGDNLRRTSEVGAYISNAFGLQDMHGNVWEWCLDGFDPDESAAQDAAATTENFPDRVVRGGSWLSAPRFCRSASRGRMGPMSRSRNHGFRVALVPASS